MRAGSGHGRRLVPSSPRAPETAARWVDAHLSSRAARRRSPDLPRRTGRGRCAGHPRTAQRRAAARCRRTRRSSPAPLAGRPHPAVRAQRRPVRTGDRRRLLGPRPGRDQDSPATSSAASEPLLVRTWYWTILFSQSHRPRAATRHPRQDPAARAARRRRDRRRRRLRHADARPGQGLPGQVRHQDRPGQRQTVVLPPRAAATARAAPAVLDLGPSTAAVPRPPRHHAAVGEVLEVAPYGDPGRADGGGDLAGGQSGARVAQGRRHRASGSRGSSPSAGRGRPADARSGSSSRSTSSCASSGVAAARPSRYVAYCSSLARNAANANGLSR